MTQTNAEIWLEGNQRCLLAALRVTHACLQNHASGEGEKTSEGLEEAREELQEAHTALVGPSTLETLCITFGLTPFEEQILLLCAGMELEARFASVCAEACGDPSRPFPTFGLALAALPEPHWSALTPSGPLRRWRLVQVGAGNTLALSPLRIDEWALHYLVGAPAGDERLAGLIGPLEVGAALTPSQEAVAEAVAAAGSLASGELPLFQLTGPDPLARRAVAEAAAKRLGIRLNDLWIDALPASPAELDQLLRLWERQAALTGDGLLVEADNLDASDATRAAVVQRVLERLPGVVVLSSRDRRTVGRRSVVAFEVGLPTEEEQHAAWHRELGPVAAELNGRVEELVSQFSLSVPSIRSACLQAASDPEGRRHSDLLWDACRVQSRPRLEELAQRIHPAAAWHDLVLPDAQRATLREIAAQVRKRALVYGRWGFARKGGRGLGIAALFAGVSGTGKTLAAEVLAAELRLDLYRVDLSQVVSKYIGETEKNLRRVFDAADEGGAILLFDEADALFGKRSEVKDSHDRYANIEVSYLLQRMEEYRGLAILTTNLKSALDPAFLRRLRFVVEFPFPDVQARAEIWGRIFPTETPTEALDLSKLARLNIAGGSIRNIALGAAFLAADAGQPVRMRHLLRATRSEYAKMEKPLSESEVTSWV